MALIRKQDEVIKPYAYYATGGKAAFFYQPETVKDLSEALKEIDAKKLPFFYLGAGTNSLVSDQYWQGAVISFAKMRTLERSGNQFRVGAGIENSEFAKAALAAKLEGAAWMYRLPGQMGGTVRMNARCYGGEISQIVSLVTTVTASGQIKTYGKDDGVFRGYKDTVFMENNEAIAEVVIELKPGDAKQIEEVMLFCEKDRESKGQFVYPTCGCVFKNDYSVGVPSGMLLDTSGAKTLVQEGVKINPHHANFVYNVGAGSEDILAMTLKMREAVYARYGVWMDYEMELLGDFSSPNGLKLKDVRSANWDQPALEALRAKFRTK